jgi:hypothetical protein
LLKERVGRLYGPQIYGGICDILEEKEPELPEDSKDDEVIAKNLDLTNVASKDPGKPSIQPNKPASTDGGA